MFPLWGTPALDQLSTPFGMFQLHQVVNLLLFRLFPGIGRHQVGGTTGSGAEDGRSSVLGLVLPGVKILTPEISYFLTGNVDGMK